MHLPSVRPTWLEIDLGALLMNLEHIRARVAPAQVMVVLKANAYGHGVDGVAPFIAPYADYLGVALPEEGIHLREMGIDKPILVMGGLLKDQLSSFIQHGLTLTVGSSELLQAAEAAAAAAHTTIRTHLKIDTGMERIGVHEYESEKFLEESLTCRHLDVEGIFTHFANSETADLTHARTQLARFEEVLSFYERHSVPPPPLRHAANSGAVLQLPESYLDMVRPGILFYGIYPDVDTAHTVEVHPGLSWKSRVAFSKVTPAARPVSYGSLWQSDHPVRIVTIPCGYGDGYFRRMTNRAQVLLNGRMYPQVGRICMDQFMVNVEADEAALGDEVVLLGKAGAGLINAYDLAAWAGTNPYEILTNINTRVPRVYVAG